MSQLDDTLERILSSPESMEKIMAIAGGLSSPEKSPPPKEEAPPPKETPDIPQAEGDRTSALLSAIKPYLGKERAGKIDAALNAARLAHSARLIIDLLKLQNSRGEGE